MNNQKQVGFKPWHGILLALIMSATILADRWNTGDNVRARAEASMAEFMIDTCRRGLVDVLAHGGTVVPCPSPNTLRPSAGEQVKRYNGGKPDSWDGWRCTSGV